MSWIDKVAPQWAAKRSISRLQKMRTESAMSWLQATQDGYAIPGSSKKSMKGITATANSSDVDTIPKLDGMRAISRDLFMSSPLAAAIIKRAQINIVGGGLQYESRIDREVLGMSMEEARAWQEIAEREFNLFADNKSCDFNQQHTFDELQIIVMLTVLLSGDIFFMFPFSDHNESPYSTSLKLISPDLVRNPEDLNGRDIEGGVEKDKAGRVKAYHVWNTYSSDLFSTGDKATSIRVPVFDSEGRRQIYHVMSPDRVSQRRGVPMLAPVANALQQMKRISEAQMMNILVRSFFTVFVKDMSGLGSLMQEGFTPNETVTGGGSDGPNAAPEDKNAGDEFDLEMGYGNVTYVDDKKDITLADPNQSDDAFDKLWNTLATEACAGANVPAEQALLKFNTSYTAARAATLEAWKFWRMGRKFVSREFNRPVLERQQGEAIFRGRIVAAGYYDDFATQKAWQGAAWLGAGQGYLNPLDEIKAARIALAANLSTHSEEYAKAEGGKWSSAMERKQGEESLLESLDLLEQVEVGIDGTTNVE